MVNTTTLAYDIPDIQNSVLLVTGEAENSKALDYVVQKAVEMDKPTLEELSEWEQEVETFSFSVKPVKEVK